MYKGYFTAGAYTSNVDMPMTQITNTNDNYSLSNTQSQLVITKVGVTDVNAAVVFTASGTTDISAQLYADGVAIPHAISTVTPVDGSTYTLNIVYPLLVNQQVSSDKVELSVRLNQSCTIVDGYLTAEYRQ